MKKTVLLAVVPLILAIVGCSKNDSTNCDWSDSTFIGKSYKITNIQDLSILCPKWSAQRIDSFYTYGTPTVTFLANNELVVNSFLLNLDYSDSSRFIPMSESVGLSKFDDKWYLSKSSAGNILKTDGKYGTEEYLITRFDCNSFTIPGRFQSYYRGTSSTTYIKEITLTKF